MKGITNVGKHTFSFFQETEMITCMFEGFHKGCCKCRAFQKSHHFMQLSLILFVFDLLFFFSKLL